MCGSTIYGEYGDLAGPLLKRLKVRVVDCPCVDDFTVDDRCGACLADVAAIANAEGRN